MEFAEWEPVYEAVLADFGYSRAGDEAARDLLADLLDGESLDAATLSLGGTVAVVAPGPSLAAERERARARSADAVVAASTAADRLADAGVAVDVQVTDLDGDPARAIRRTRDGTPVAVHAHGDNRDALRATVPDCRADRLTATVEVGRPSLTTPSGRLSRAAANS